MTKFYIAILFLFIGDCTTQNKISDYKGGVVKYKYVDPKGNWLEVGIEKDKKNYLIYVPKEYVMWYQVGDTIN